jgi:hypothetical protein
MLFNSYPSFLLEVITSLLAAKLSTSASNNSVNPDPGRAQGTLTCRTPCAGQRTRTDAVLTTLTITRNPGRTGHTPGTRDAHGEPPQESQVKAGVAPTT